MLDDTRSMRPHDEPPPKSAQKEGPGSSLGQRGILFPDSRAPHPHPPSSPKMSLSSLFQKEGKGQIPALASRRMQQNEYVRASRASGSRHNLAGTRDPGSVVKPKSASRRNSRSAAEPCLQSVPRGVRAVCSGQSLHSSQGGAGGRFLPRHHFLLLLGEIPGLGTDSYRKGGAWAQASEALAASRFF